MSEPAPVYDSAEETERELRSLRRNDTANASGTRTKLRIIRRRPQTSADTAAGAAQTTAFNANATPSAYPVHTKANPTPGTKPKPASAGTSNHGTSSSGQPPRMPAFPSTLFWSDKMQTLGAVYLVAEALVRTIMMESEEFADRVAWVALERLVKDLKAVRPDLSRVAALAEVRRMLGEIRATHAAFHTAIDYTFVHGGILILLRVTHLAALSADFATSPYSYTLDRHVQDLVFLCDFAGMVLSRITLSDAPHHEHMTEQRPGSPALWMPAHYANETLTRALAPLDAGLQGEEAFSTSAVARAASKLLNDHSQSVSNSWLARNLLRLAIGYKILGQAFESTETRKDTTDASPPSAATAAPSAPLRIAAHAAIEEILRERATAIHTWTQRNGSEVGAVFMDPLYRVEDEIVPRRVPT
jgi:hypothetical protein